MAEVVPMNVDWQAVSAVASILMVPTAIAAAVYTQRLTVRAYTDRNIAWSKNLLVLIAKAHDSARLELDELGDLDAVAFTRRAGELHRAGARGWVREALKTLVVEPPPTTALFDLMHRAKHAIELFDQALFHARVIGQEDSLPRLQAPFLTLRECCVGIGQATMRLGGRSLALDNPAIHDWLPSRRRPMMTFVAPIAPWFATTRPARQTDGRKLIERRR